MKKRIFFCGLFVFWIGVSLYAQIPFRTGLLPQININKKLINKWKFNTKVESRQILYNGTFNEKNALDYQYERIDFAFVLSKKTGTGHSISGGYLLRTKIEEFLHRTLFQYSIVRNYTALRLGQRIATDQTFQKDTPVKIRLRYRIGIDWALNGQSVDPQEFYIKLTNEYLWIIQQSDYDFELRLKPSLGYTFTDNNKLELGLDYRIDRLRNKPPRHNFWIPIAWFVSF